MAEVDTQKLLDELDSAARQLNNNRRAEAMLIYQDVSRRAGEHPGVQYQLGRLCADFGDLDKAIEHYRSAVDTEPENPQYLASLGIAYQGSGQTDAADEVLLKAASLAPDVPEVLHALGNIAMERGDYANARTHFERAIELKPSNAGARANLAMALARLDEHDAALEHARKAVRLDDSMPRAHFALCSVLTETGEIDEAARHMEKTLRKHGTFGVGYDLLSRIKKFSGKDDAFIRKAEKMLDRGMPVKDRYSLHYALGKMHDDCGRYDEAFAHFEQANLLHKLSHDFAGDEKLFRRMKSAFGTGSLDAWSGLGHSSAKPIFIVGMPRTGTTLMEQMIAAHPQGEGAGELAELPRIAREYLDGGRGTPAADVARGYAEQYLAVLTRGRGDAERIVDKMPSNFFFLGLITALFPNATILHAIRNPLDTCLSCYFQSFADVAWANDFESIARMYRLYRDVMEYWQRILPEGRIVDVHYEALVADPDLEGRRMIEACGLDWDDAVLEFHRARNVVRTASIAQVRQPVYRTSTMRWTRYASHIEPLARQLAPYLEDERAALEEHGISLPAVSGGWLSRLLRGRR